MIGFFENLLFIGKFQKMIGLMILVKSGVHKILFSLRLTVITVCHHQIPVNFFLHDILRYVEGIFAFAHILDNGSSGTAFLQNLTERGLLKLLALLHGSFREYPSFIFIFIIFIKQKDLPPKNYYTAAARCFYHCNSSCPAISDSGIQYTLNPDTGQVLFSKKNLPKIQNCPVSLKNMHRTPVWQGALHNRFRNPRFPRLLSPQSQDSLPEQSL